MLGDPDTAVAIVIAAREGSGLPVTVSCAPAARWGSARASTSRCGSSRRPASRAWASTPCSAAVHHKGVPDDYLAAELVASVPVPVIVSGGMDEPGHIRWVFEHTGAAAVMLARIARKPVAVRAAGRPRAPAHAR